MNNLKNKNAMTFWTSNNKKILAAGTVPMLVLIVHVLIGFEYLERLIPYINFFASITLAFVAVIALLISSTYLSVSYMFMVNENETSKQVL